MNNTYNTDQPLPNKSNQYKALNTNPYKAI